jgi:hypothetical protein
VPNHPGLFLVLYGVVVGVIVGGGEVLVGGGLVGGGEVLVGGGLVGDVLWVGVGVGDFTGGGLKTGL